MKEKRKKTITVIGAGLSGLYTASKLCENGYSVNILEKNRIVGGLSASIPENGYQIDIGPHYMTLKKESKITDEIIELVGKDELITINNIEKSYLSYYQQKILYSFPTIMDAVFASGVKSLVSSTISILKKKSSALHDNNTSASNYLKACFGDYLFRVWCEPYLIQNFGTLDLPLEYVKNRFRPITIKKILEKLVNKNKKNSDEEVKKTSEIYIDCYFKSGIGSLVNLLEKQIKEDNGNIILNANIISIDHTKKSITYKKNNQQVTLDTDIIVYATSPKIISNWFQDIKKDKNDVKKTHFNSIMTFLFIDTKKLFDGWLMSIFDTKIPFFRLSQQNFLSDGVGPKGKTLLTAEIRLDENDELWTKNDQEIKTLVEEHLKKMNIMKNHHIEGFKIIKFPNLYPKFNPVKKFSNSTNLELMKNTKNEYILGTVEQDTGRFVTAESKINDDHVPSTGGIYNAISNSKKIIKNILEDDD